MISPILVFDSHEKGWFPVGVKESLEAVQPSLRPGKDGNWTPDFYKVPGIQCLDFPANMKAPRLPAVGNVRVVPGGDLYWAQFWFWYLYQPFLAGLGDHEGDWEFVQFACTDAACDHPVLATYSQHQGGGKREYWALEQMDGHPVVYVALGSHANYFTAGIHAEDRCDGKGCVLTDIEWRDFGPWASWSGKWGHSDTSPQSPGRQRQRWTQPHLFHSAARGQ